MPLPEQDTSVGHSFGLEIDGVLTQLSEVSGLVIPALFAVHRDETGSLVTRKLPSRKKAGEITLSRGLTSDSVFMDWVDDANSGNPTKARSSVFVVILDEEGTEVRRYKLTSCWPQKWSVGTSAGSSLAVERLTLSYAKAEPV